MKYFYIAVVCLLLSSLSGQDLYDINTITTVEITFAESNWDQILDSYYSAGDEERLIGSAVINGVAFDSVGVRYKGNSSYNAYQAKNPLNIKLDHIIDDQDYQGYGTLKLANGYQDPSFIRETLGYEVASMYMPASQSNYANVYINGQLKGLYTSDQSVDKEFKNDHFPSGRDIRFKGEVQSNGQPSEDSIWDYVGADSTDYEYYYELKSDTGWSELIDFLDVLNNDTDNIEDYLNVDNHLWMLAFDNLTVNLDSPINFSHNYYLFKDASDRFNPIIWDLNEGFGGFSMLLSGGNLNTTGLKQLNPLLNLNDATYPIISKILTNSTYQKMYFAHMRTMMEEVFESGWFETRANEIQAIIADAISVDPNFAYSDSQFASNVTSTVTTGGGPMASSVIGLTELMDARCAWLRQQSYFAGDVPELANISTEDNVLANSETIITLEATNATELWINYRSSIYDKFTSVEMFDDGNHNDGTANDGVFGVSIPTAYSDLEYYFYGQNSNQGAFLPAKAAIEFYTLDITSLTADIVINEINYSSSDEFDAGDWVELYNPNSDTVDLSGWTFKDSDDDHAFVIPENTMLAGYGYLILTKDSAGFSTVYPGVTNSVGDFDFGLSSSSDSARMYDANGTLIDIVEYLSDGDWPSEPSGTGSTLELINPSLDNSLASSWQASELLGTPATVNGGANTTIDIIINEINYSSSDEYDAGDWVELYNPNDYSVDLAGWTFKDSDDEHVYVIPENTTIESNGYLILTKDSASFSIVYPEVTNYIGDFDFGLGSSEDMARIYGVNQNLIDTVLYLSEGEWPAEANGTGSTLELINPNLDNSLASSWQASELLGTPGTVNSSASSINSIVINEINYSSSDEFDAGDWVELYNPNVNAIDISGWIFKDSDDDHIFEIPANTTIVSNGYLVLTKDAASFSIVYPEVTNYIGDFDFGLGSSEDVARLYDTNADLIDFVLYTSEGDWPSLPNGNGNTLELISYDLDNSLASSWQASEGLGTPGALNSDGAVANDDNNIEQVNISLANYPNPFNPQTTISFAMEKAAYVSLNIYNIKGQLVKTLVNSNLNSGDHSVVWNGDNSQGLSVSSGIYFSRLTYNNKTKTHKMTLSK